jgi:hypothetical protein
MMSALFAPLVMRRSPRTSWIFQRTDDAMMVAVLLLGIPAQLGCVLWVGAVVAHPLVAAALAPLALFLFLRCGKLVRIREGEVRSRPVFFGVPLPGVTTLRGPIRIERREHEQDFGVLLPVVALVAESDPELAIELVVQPAEEEVLRRLLEDALREPAPSAPPTGPYR